MFKSFEKYRRVYKHLWKSYGQSWFVRISFLINLITRICKLVVLPIAVSLVITRLSSKNYRGAFEAVALFSSTTFVIGVLTPLVKYVGILGENKVYDQSTGYYFSQLIHTDLDYFNDNLGGYLTTATRHYVDSCLQLVRAMRDRYMTTILSILFPLTVIFWVDHWLGLVALALSVVQAGYLLWASSAVTPMRSYSREVYKRNSGKMADAIANILAIRSTAQETVYAKAVQEEAHKEAEIFKTRYAKQAKLTAVREFISMIFFLLLLWLTVRQMSHGYIHLTAAILIVTYSTTILGGIYALSDDLDDHDDWVDKIIPAFEVIDRQNRITDPKRPRQLTEVRGELRLENVTFSYDTNSKPVFENFSLTIPAGQKVGIVGLSGAGKSTLAKLLMRFNDIDNGTISLDKFNIRDFRQADLRRQIAYVPQEPLLFHDTIKNNILLADPKATAQQIERALKAAHAWQFIQQLPDGIDSVVGERGVKLSGGQKQRIAIARAVLRQCPIIVLDEATSALDSESEHIIKASFAEVLKNKTAIVIAHRLSTLSDMDRIVVIDKGRCVEDGTHQELLALGGAYARLWNRQLKHIED